jgi:type IV secretory pathway TrbD component
MNVPMQNVVTNFARHIFIYAAIGKNVLLGVGDFAVLAEGLQKTATSQDLRLWLMAVFGII